MQVENVPPEAVAQVRPQKRPERGELGEQERAVTLGEDLLEDLLHALELAGSPRQGRAVREHLGRVIADLLEAQHRGKDQPAPLDSLARLDPRHHLGDDRLVQGRLLARERAVDGHLELLGQVGDDCSVGLEAAQDERRRRSAEPPGSIVVAVAFDGNGEALPERVGRSEEARVQDLHDRPELREAVLDRRPGERDPAGCPDAAGRLGLPGRTVLDVLGLVQHETAPVDCGERLDVARDEPVRRDDEVDRGAGRCEILSAKPVASVVDVDGQARREAFRLAAPVLHDGHGTDDKGGPGVGGRR